MSRRVALVRHARTAWRGHRFIGSTDPAIDESGACLEGLAGHVRALGRSCYYASPSRRALETARAVLGPTADLIVDPDLREVDFGRWEGLTFDEARAQDAAAVGQWLAGDPAFAFPGGERMHDFLERTRSAAARLAAQADDTVVAFTHAGVIRHLICHYLDLPDRRHPLLFQIRHAACATVELVDGKGILSGLNLSAPTEVAPWPA